MDKFDQAIYEFLTEPNNFEQVLKVQEHFGMIRLKLLEDFWQLVLDKLNEKIGDEKGKWHAKRNLKIYERWSSLWLVKESWRAEVNGESMPLAISWESLSQDIHYGVWIKNDSKVWNPELMREEGRKIAQKHQMDSDNHYWPVRFYYPKNFNDNQNLIQILPENRESLAEEFASLLWDIATTFEENLDKMYQMRRS